MLILAGVSIVTLGSQNGIINRAKNAKLQTEREEASEKMKLKITEIQTNSYKENGRGVTLQELADAFYDDDEIEYLGTKSGKENPGTGKEKVELGDSDDLYVKFKNFKYEFGLNKDLEIESVDGIQTATGGDASDVTIGGEKITKDNVAKYLGKKVTNYVGGSSVMIGSKTYEVSPEYRLYYIDFEGKYGEKNTIYLKAEYIEKHYILSNIDTTTSADATNIKIKQLNPELYKDGNTGPATSNDNMKAVTWLTNITNWASLADTKFDINYIVGAPSVEMMMDSYNMRYALKETDPKIGEITSDSSRRRLFYSYTQGWEGYKLGPGTSDSWSSSMVWVPVIEDTAVGSMYCPDVGCGYWLSSPSDYSKTCLMGCQHSESMENYKYIIEYESVVQLRCFCPLVSLSPSNVLTF